MYPHLAALHRSGFAATERSPFTLQDLRIEGLLLHFKLNYCTERICLRFEASLLAVGAWLEVVLRCYY